MRHQHLESQPRSLTIVMAHFLCMHNKALFQLYSLELYTNHRFLGTRRTLDFLSNWSDCHLCSSLVYWCEPSIYCKEQLIIWRYVSRIYRIITDTFRSDSWRFILSSYCSYMTFTFPYSSLPLNIAISHSPCHFKFFEI